MALAFKLNLKTIYFLAGLIIFNLVVSWGVTLSNPIVFGDEGYYANHARKLVENAVIPKYEYVSTDIYLRPFVKPPLYIFLDGFAWLLLGELGLKLMLPIFSTLTALVIYIFMKKYYSERAGFFAAFIFLMTPALITYSVLNYVDSFLALLFSLGLFFGYRAIRDNHKKDYIMTGVISGLAILTKVSGLILPLLFLIYFATRKFHNYKKLLLIIAITAAVVFPWVLRGTLLFGEACYGIVERCDDITTVAIETNPNLKFAGELQQVGTNVGFFDIGLVFFSDFAFGYAVFLLTILGLALMFFKRSPANRYIVLSLFVFAAIFLVGGGYRSEDTARFLVPAVVGMAIISGNFLENIYSYVKEKRRFIAVLLILLILYATWAYGSSKLSTMNDVKAFSSGFLLGCDWVKKNTAEDSKIFTIYAHQTNYQCERSATARVPDKADIQLSYNDTSYEHLKLHGFDYVYVQGFALDSVAYTEVFTYDFLNYLDKSPKFEKVYDNTQQFQGNGVVLYQVL